MFTAGSCRCRRFRLARSNNSYRIGMHAWFALHSTILAQQTTARQNRVAVSISQSPVSQPIVQAIVAVTDARQWVRLFRILGPPRTSSWTTSTRILVAVTAAAVTVVGSSSPAAAFVRFPGTLPSPAVAFKCEHEYDNDHDHGTERIPKHRMRHHHGKRNSRSCGIAPVLSCCGVREKNDAAIQKPHIHTCFAIHGSSIQSSCLRRILLSVFLAWFNSLLRDRCRCFVPHSSSPWRQCRCLRLWSTISQINAPTSNTITTTLALEIMRDEDAISQRTRQVSSVASIFSIDFYGVCVADS